MKIVTRSLLLLLLAAAAVGPARADLVVVPNAQTAVEGNTADALPFNISDPSQGLSSQRLQQVYAGTQFPSAAVITHIAFRPDASSFGTAFSTTLPSIRIDLSTTAAAPDALSLTFASNVGADNAIVFGGPTGAPLTLSSAGDQPGAGPNPFDIVIPLATPFYFNPAAGNLLLDVRNFGGGQTAYFDAQNTLGDPISRVFTFNTGNVNSATADLAQTTGLVTRFTFVPVPEPGTFALFGLGALGLAGYVRRRRNPPA